MVSASYGSLASESCTSTPTHEKYLLFDWEPLRPAEDHQMCSGLQHCFIIAELEQDKLAWAERSLGSLA